MKTTLKDPFTKATLKRYFINLLSGNNDVNYYRAKINFPVLGRIVEKLTPYELEYLLDKIEELI